MFLLILLSFVFGGLIYLGRLHRTNFLSMKQLLFSVLAATVLMACNKKDDDYSQYFEAESSSSAAGEMEDVEMEADTSGEIVEGSTDQIEFTISLTDADESYVVGNETIVTDENSDEYDDFVENYTVQNTIYITYSGSTASVSGSADGVVVSIVGGHVTVSSDAKGVEYVLSGSCSDGNFKIYSEKKFKVTLSDVSLSNASGAAINCQSGKSMYIVAEAGSENSFSDASTYSTTDGEDEKACIFSEGQIIFSGSGRVNVCGNYKHAIASDDYVRVRSGSDIVVSAAAKDGIHANDAVIIGGGSIALTTTDDGINSEGTVDITGGLLTVCTTGDAAKGIKADGDMSISGGQQIIITSGAAYYDSSERDVTSCSAIKVDGNLSISGGYVEAKSTGKGGKGINVAGTLKISDGDVRVITTGTKYSYSNSLDASAKGIKATGQITISGGDVRVRATGGTDSEGIESKTKILITAGNVAVYAYDDALNATSNITIRGGSVYCYSTSNDGIDSNGTLTVSGGTIVTSGTTAPEEGFDCDQNTFAITEHTKKTKGRTTTTPTSNSSEQQSIVITTGSPGVGTVYTIMQGDTHVMSFVVPRAYSQSATILFSSPNLTSASHTLYTGGTVRGGTTF